MSKAVVRESGQGDAYWVLGGLYEVLLSAEETAGASTIMRMTVPEGGGPPPHAHSGSESTYLLEGTARFHVDGKTYEAGAGDVFHFPAGTVETFEPTSTVKLVVVYEPGGIERFFSEVGEVAAERKVPEPSDTPPDFERIVRIGEQHGMQFQPPSS